MIDLHRHLEGSIRPETVLEAVLTYKLPLPNNLPSLLPYIRVTEPDPNLMSFIGKIDTAVTILVNTNVCQKIAYEAVEDAAKEGIVYLELRFSPLYMAMHHKLQPESVVSAVIEGVRQGVKDFHINVNLIGTLSRTFGKDAVKRELKALLVYSQHFVALDLAGDEAQFPAELFEDEFSKAKEVGWHITVHAGEDAGPESVWTAIQKLGAERIGHGTRSVEDEKLIDFLIEKKIGIESAITSNLHTTTVTDITKHSLKKFLQRGILATINTDDPSISGITLSYEVTKAAPKAGLSQELIKKAQENSVEIAFLSDKEKKELKGKFTLTSS